jgi:hypothetical protein
MSEGLTTLPTRSVTVMRKCSASEETGFGGDHVQCVSVWNLPNVFVRVKCPERETDHSPLYDSEIQNTRQGFASPYGYVCL